MKCNNLPISFTYFLHSNSTVLLLKCIKVLILYNRSNTTYEIYVYYRSVIKYIRKYTLKYLLDITMTIMHCLSYDVNSLMYPDDPSSFMPILNTVFVVVHMTRTSSWIKHPCCCSLIFKPITIKSTK